MKLITIRSQIRDVARKWHAQYMPVPSKGWLYGMNKEEAYAQLAALDKETATAADVAAIIGNDSWACPQRCHECNGHFDEVVQVGEKPDYESATCQLCKACARKAACMLLTEAPSPTTSTEQKAP